MEVEDNGEVIIKFDFKEIIQNFYAPNMRRRPKRAEESSCGCVLQENKAGCGITCVSRMLQIECNPETCPCKEKCSNQRFQRRQYAKVEVFKAGEKGHGLRAKEHIGRGQFIIEYVGEIIDTASCIHRMKSSGQKHFYFITLDASEGIDATYQGNIARYINHSCEPNCITQKWAVKGENCVGIFAKEDIRMGTELTFDYQFVRVGAQKQKCLCGSDNCRGYLGARPLKQPTVKDQKTKHKFSKHNIYLQKITKENSNFDAVQKAMRLAPFINHSWNQIEGSVRPVFLKRNYRIQRTFVLESFSSMINHTIEKKRHQRAEEENKRTRELSSKNHYLFTLDIESLIRNNQVEVDPSSAPLPSKKRNK